MTQAPFDLETATIVWPGGSYTLTGDDLLWAARMIEGESGSDTRDAAAVLWCMTQRLSLGSWASFTQLIRAYSQPINPKWQRNGAFCRIDGRYYETDFCSPSRLLRRDQISTMTWEECRQSTRDVVSRWARGELSNPVPRAIEFADARVATNYVTNHPGSRITYIAANRFIVTRESAAWAEDRVRMRRTDGSLSGFGTVAAIGSASLFVLVSLAIAIYIWVKK